MVKDLEGRLADSQKHHMETSWDLQCWREAYDELHRSYCSLRGRFNTTRRAAQAALHSLDTRRHTFGPPARFVEHFETTYQVDHMDYEETPRKPDDTKNAEDRDPWSDSENELP